MANADGSVIFSCDLDSTKVQKKLGKLRDRGLSYHQFNIGHIKSPAVKLLHKPQLPENL